MTSRQSLKASREAHRRGVHFLRTELHTALTLVEVSRTAKDSTKQARNRLNARRGFDELMRFRDRVRLNAEELGEFEAGITSLRNKLKELGEDM